MKSFAVFVAAASALAASSLAAFAQPATVKTETGTIAIENIADGLNHPWGIAFLPDGRMLVTERAGNLRIITKDGAVSEPLEGVPESYARGQGGLLDVALDPDFQSNKLVYLSLAAPGDGGSSTAVGRGRFENDRLMDFQILFRQTPMQSNGYHFGSRIVFSPDGHLFLTTGERFLFNPAQDLGNHLGKVIRINRDGSIPEDNPFVNQSGAKAEIWSYGHRNIQAAAIHPETGALWIAEMGPRGGDELNRPEAGKNYGWPVVSWGQNYDGSDIADPPTRPEFTDAVRQWTPVIAPSGMLFYTGGMFPEWQGSMFIGGLASRALVRLTIEGNEVTGEERIPLGARIRDVEQGPDGSIYLLTDQDDGNVWRLRPANQ